MAEGIKYDWIKIADSLAELQFDENNLLQLEAGGKKICIGKQKEGLFACTHTCPHAGGIMADGYIDALGNIVCPLHRYKFNPANGRNISGEGYFLKTYPVEIRENGVFAGMPANNFLNFFK